MNKSNAVRGDKPVDPPRYWKIQPTAVHFKYDTPNTNTITVVSAILGILNNHAVENGNV